WPSHPPYEGIHDVVMPHPTVAYGADALLDAVDADITPKLPFDAVVTEAALLEELAPESRWTRARPLPAQPRSALKRCHRPGTPLSGSSPRSSNSIPEPATRSVTVDVTSTSPGAAFAATRAPTWTEMPPRPCSSSSTSPEWTPARTSSPSRPAD